MTQKLAGWGRAGGSLWVDVTPTVQEIRWGTDFQGEGVRMGLSRSGAVLPGACAADPASLPPEHMGCREQGHSSSPP